MAMSKNLKKQWRVQVRTHKEAAWKNKGLFETRRNARERAAEMRDTHWENGNRKDGYGMRNTRAVPYVKGGAK